jgi:CBS domain-containing protein
VVGIISRRDFSKIRRKNQMGLPVKAFMSTNVKTIGTVTSIVDATRLLVKHDIGRLPVVENGKLIGIVTRTDAMHYYYDLLPR